MLRARLHVITIFAAVAASMLMPLSAGRTADNAAVTPRTYAQIVASYIYLLPQLIEWPKGTFPDQKTPFVVGILGDDPFAQDPVLLDGIAKPEADESALEVILRYLDPGFSRQIGTKAGENKVMKRNLVVKRFPKLQPEIASCQLLFVSSSMEKRLAEILKITEKAGVLTIGELPEFIDRQGIINCVGKKTVDGKEKVLVGVNLGAARRNNLKLDQKLYSVFARRIES